ncbi:hypothetical protein Tco_1293265 [Tanacetum coccineum]
MAPSVGPVTTSPVLTKSNNLKNHSTYFSDMTNGREMTPPPGFSTPPQIPNNTTSERPPVITTVFDATTPENTPFTFRASTSANRNPMISPAFVDANYEVLESLLRERLRQIRNEALRTELEYFNEDYDEEGDMQQERVVGFEEAPDREGSRRGRNAKGIRPLKIKAREDKNRGVNLPWCAHLGRKQSGNSYDPLGSV